MKKRFCISKLIMILVIPVLILFTSLYVKVFDQDYYSKQFEKNDVYQNFEINKTQLDKVNSELLDYIKKGYGEINVSVGQGFFNEREKLHLQDVKKLITLFKSLFYCCITLFVLLGFIIYFKNEKKFGKNLRIILIAGGTLYLILASVFCWIMFTDFSGSFTGFHKIFFESDSWIFEPSDNLIKMYPQQFFYDISFKIVSDSVIFSVLMVIILVYCYRLFWKKK